MRPHLFVLIIMILATVALASAQEDEPPLAEPVRIPEDSRSEPFFGPLTGVWSEVPVQLEEVADPQLTLDHGADFCDDAPSLGLATFGTAGDQVVVNDMSSSTSDPVLGCMWGNPQSPRGFRTVWYKFRAPVSGRLVVSTGFLPSEFEDSYDTVLALYRSADGTCGSLTQLVCDDDSNGFLSEVNYFVIEGQTYYVEVADWDFDSQAAATLRLSVVLEEGETLWQRLLAVSNRWLNRGYPRSRHSVVTDGRFVYIVGGETAVKPFPERIEVVDRFDTRTRTWSQMKSTIPQGDGYSRTSAAFLNGRIYLASGYTGNNEAYKGTHWFLDVRSDVSGRVASVPWSTASPSGQPYAWHQAVSSPQENGYYMVGGLLSGSPEPVFPSDAQPTSRLLFYNAGGDRWTTILPNMSQARYAHVADLLSTPQGRRVCTTGGLSKATDEQLVVLRSAECYNTSTGQWSNIAPLNFARFSAGSAVGPDGRWYVFGGVDAQLNPVILTEVYDPATNTWQVLDSRFGVRNPGRAWPRGVFAGDALWIFGGEEVLSNEVVPLVERLAIPGTGPTLWLPVALRATLDPSEPNNTLDEARPIALNQPQRHIFDDSDDFFDFYRFQVTERDVYIAHVTDIPENNDYDVYLFNSNKLVVGSATLVGSLDEMAISFPLDPGTYYAMVLRVFGQPSNDPYRIVITR